jgi:hypothetical protein
MPSLLEIVREEEITERPVTLRSLLSIHKSTIPSLRALLASHEMFKKYVKVGAGVGALGPLTSGVSQTETGSYRINTELGFLDLSPGSPPVAMGEYNASVELAAVKCIGTEDPGGLEATAEDEVYGFVSLFSLLPTNQEQVNTHRLNTIEHVKAGEVIFKNTPIGIINLIAGTNGFKIHVTLWDEEVSGPPENSQEKINEAIQKGIAGVAAGSGAITAVAPNPVTGIIAVGAAAIAAAMEVEWVRDGVGFLTGWLSEALQDEKIGEKEFKVSPAQLKKWSTQEGFDASLKSQVPGLPSDVSFNFPEDYDNPDWIFSEGGATYKVFFKVKGQHVDPFPIG